MKKLWPFDEGCAKQSKPAKTPGSGVFSIKNARGQWKRPGWHKKRPGWHHFARSGVFLENCRILGFKLVSGAVLEDIQTYSDTRKGRGKERKRGGRRKGRNSGQHSDDPSPNPNSTQREHGSYGFCCKFYHVFRLNSLCCSKL